MKFPTTDTVVLQSLLEEDFSNLNFEMAIQRNEVWKHERKSLWIHSALTSFPTNPVHAIQNVDGTMDILDGKQRLTTLQRFFAEQFSIVTRQEAPHFPYVEIDEEMYDICGLHYSQLPDKLKKAFKNYKLLFYVYTAITDEEIEELFIRLNNGESLTKQELTRVLAGTPAMNFIKEITGSNFFRTSCAFTDTQRNRANDEEVVQQIMMMEQADDYKMTVGFGGDDIRNFALNVKAEGMDEEINNKIRKVVKFMGEAIPETFDKIKKNHIPMIYLMGVHCMQANWTPAQFGGMVENFFFRIKNKDKVGKFSASEYSNTMGSGTAKLGKVKDRIKQTKLWIESILAMGGASFQWQKPQKGKKITGLSADVSPAPNPNPLPKPEDLPAGQVKQGTEGGKEGGVEGGDSQNTDPAPVTDPAPTTENGTGEKPKGDETPAPSGADESNPNPEPTPTPEPNPTPEGGEANTGEGGAKTDSLEDADQENADKLNL